MCVCARARVCMLQAHMDAAGLLIKNVYRPLQEVATHKGSHIQQLIAFREILEGMLDKDSDSLTEVTHVAVA